MDVSQIIARARTLGAKATTINISDATALSYLNTVKDEFWSAIIEAMDENYGWQEWKATTVAGQTEYTFPVKTATSDALKKLKSVSIAYTNSTYPNGGLIYTKAYNVESVSLDMDWDEYVNKGSIHKPIYSIVDNSVRIAPAPTTAIVRGLKLTGPKEIEDYTLTTVEGSIGFEKEHHMVLVWGLAELMAFDKGLPAEDMVNLNAKYETKKRQAIKMLAERKEGATTFLYPEDITDSFYGN